MLVVSGDQRRIRSGGPDVVGWKLRPLAFFVGTLPGFEKLGLTRQASQYPKVDVSTLLQGIQNYPESQTNVIDISPLKDCIPTEYFNPLGKITQAGAAGASGLSKALDPVIAKAGAAATVVGALMHITDFLLKQQRVRQLAIPAVGTTVSVLNRNHAPALCGKWVKGYNSSQQVEAAVIANHLVQHMVEEEEATLVLATGTRRLRLFGLVNSSTPRAGLRTVKELLSLEGEGVPWLMQAVADRVTLDSSKHVHKAVGWHRARRIEEAPLGSLFVEGTSPDIRLGFCDERVPSVSVPGVQSNRCWRDFVNFYGESNNAGMSKERDGEEENLVGMQLGLALGFLAAKYVPTFEPSVELWEQGEFTIGNLTIAHVQRLDKRFGAGASGLSMVGSGSIVLWNTSVSVLWGQQPPK